MESLSVFINTRREKLGMSSIGLAKRSGVDISIIEDIESGVKNTNDINLVVAWEAGERYKDNYIIESLLIAGNEGLRRYHGVTHHLHDANTNEYVCDLILLQDLILYLNDKNESDILQETYDE